VVVADALHCQKETAEAVIEGKAGYLLSVKDNQRALKADIGDYVQDGVLRKGMDTFETVEKRRAFTTGDIGWLYGREEWRDLSCIGRYTGKPAARKERRTSGNITYPAGT
jgi:hypothetical protein